MYFSHSLSHVQLFTTPWTVAHQAPLSIGFSRQAYRTRLPFPTPGDLSDPGIKPESPALAGRFFTTEPPGKPKPPWMTKINSRGLYRTLFLLPYHLLPMIPQVGAPTTLLKLLISQYTPQSIPQVSCFNSVWTEQTQGNPLLQPPNL